MSKKPIVKMLASFDPLKKCIKLTGSGTGTITFDTDETQLLKLIQTLAILKERNFELSLRPLSETEVREVLIGKKSSKKIEKKSPGQDSEKVYK